MTGRYDNYSMIINFIITRDVMKYIFLKILRQFLSYNYVAHCTRNIWGNFYLKFNLFKKEKLLEDIFFSNRTFFFFSNCHNSKILSTNDLDKLDYRTKPDRAEGLYFYFVKFHSYSSVLQYCITNTKRKLSNILLYDKGHALDRAICSHKQHGSDRNL